MCRSGSGCGAHAPRAPRPSPFIHSRTCGAAAHARVETNRRRRPASPCQHPGRATCRVRGSGRVRLAWVVNASPEGATVVGSRSMLTNRSAKQFSNPANTILRSSSGPCQQHIASPRHADDIAQGHGGLRARSLAAAYPLTAGIYPAGGPIGEWTSQIELTGMPFSSPIKQLT